MDKVKSVYKKAGVILSKRPWAAWGITLLANLIILIGSVLSGAVPIIGIIFEVLIMAALELIYVRCLFNEKIEVEDIFVVFKDWNTVKHVLGGMLWAELWVFLWALIPVAGIVFATIRSYEYKFVPYILMTEPEIGAKEALTESKKRTLGLKSKMFWADVIASVSMFLVIFILFAMATLKYVGWIFAIVFIATILIATFVFPFFMGLVHAIFFVDEERSREESRFYVVPEVKKEEPVNETDSSENAPFFGEKFCTACGAPMRNEDIFCAACGTKFDSVPVNQKEEVPDTVSEEQVKPEEKDEIQKVVEKEE